MLLIKGFSIPIALSCFAFRCNIPVVIIGETGCGKTRLVRYMCQLQAALKMNSQSRARVLRQTFFILKVSEIGSFKVFQNLKPLLGYF